MTIGNKVYGEGVIGSDSQNEQLEVIIFMDNYKDVRLTLDNSNEFVNEGSSTFFTLKFKDVKGRNIIPNEITYTITDILSGDTVLFENTEIPTSYRYDLIIPSEANLIIDENSVWEERLLTVVYQCYNNYIGTFEYIYRVKNLIRIPIT